MAVTPVLIADQGPTSTPAVYTVPASQELNPTSVFAEFDGSAAAGSFIPVLRFVAQSGETLSQTFPTGVTLTTGDVARVTFAPFGFSSSQAPSGTGLEFDTDPQPGDWFVASTTDVTPAKFPDPVTGNQYGWVFQADPATSGRGTLITASGDGSPQLHALDVDVEASAGIAKGLFVTGAAVGGTLLVGGDCSLDPTDAGVAIGWRSFVDNSADGDATGGTFNAVTEGLGTSAGVNAFASSLGAGDAQGVTAQAAGADAGIVQGVHAEASGSGTGDTTAYFGLTNVQTGGPNGLGLVLELNDGAAGAQLTPLQIFINGVLSVAVDGTGNLHLLTTATVINDL